MSAESDASESPTDLGDFLILSRNVLYNIASQAIVGITGLAAIPVLTRSLQIEEYAFFSFLLLFLTSMTILEGLRPPFIQLIHEYEEKELPAPFLWVAAGVNVVFALVMFAVAFAVFWYLGPKLADLSDALFVSVGVFFLFAGSLPSAAVAAAQEVGVVQLSRSTAVAATYASFVILALLDTGIEYFAVSVALFQVLLLAAYVVLAYRYYYPRLAQHSSSVVDGSEVRVGRVITQCLDGLISGISGAVENFADRLMVYLLVPAAAYATYSLAYDVGIRLAAVALMIGYPLFTLLSERLRHGEDQIFGLYAGIAKATLFVMMLLAVTGIYWAREILMLFGGERYLEGVAAIQTVLFATLVAGLAVVSIPFLRAVGDFRSQWMYKFLGGGVTMVLAWWWINEFGIVGGGLALIVGRLCSNASLVAVAKGQMREFGDDVDREGGMNFRIRRWFLLSLVFCFWAYLPLSGGVLEFAVLLLLMCGVSVALIFPKRDRKQAILLCRHLYIRVGCKVRERIS